MLQEIITDTKGLLNKHSEYSEESKMACSAAQEIIKSALKNSKGLTLTNVEANIKKNKGWCSDESKTKDLNWPAYIKLDFKLDEETDLRQVWEYLAQLKIPDLTHDLRVSYSAPGLIADKGFCLNNYHRFVIEKKFELFDAKPWLQRSDFTSQIHVKYLKYRGTKFAAGKDSTVKVYQIGKKLWNPLLRDIADQFNADVDIEITGEEILEMADKFTSDERSKKRQMLYEELERNPHLEETNPAAGIVLNAIVNLAFKRRGLRTQKSELERTYEKTFSNKELRELEVKTGLDLSDFIEQISVIDMDIDFSYIVKRIRDAEMEGLQEGKVNFSDDEMRAFLEYDVQHMYEDIAQFWPEVKKMWQGFGANYHISEGYMKPLWQQLETLTGIHLLDLTLKWALTDEGFFLLDGPKQEEEFNEKMKQVGVSPKLQEEIKQKYVHRPFFNDILTELQFLDICKIYNECLNRRWQEEPETLLQIYKEQYVYNRPRMSIKGEIEGKGPVPNISDAVVTGLSIKHKEQPSKRDPSTYIWNPSLNSISYGLREGKQILSFVINMDDSTLIPVQEKILNLVSQK
jgi:hypothetical protein